MRLGWLVVVAACGGHAAPRPVPVVPVAAPAPDPHARFAARARADAALHSDVVLDYARPFTFAPLDRTSTAKLFGEACADGDKHACIVEAELRPLDAAGASYHTVAAHCLAGDAMSCRALPADEVAARFPSAPGATSRSAACQHHKADCDLDVLRRECTAGFPAACGELGIDEENDRWVQLSVDGCKHGIASECENVSQLPTNEHDRFELAQRLCDLRPDDCTPLAFVYEARHDKSAARDAWERECELGTPRWGVCIQLAERYKTGALDEPVPGRGQALLDWACPQVKANLGDAALAHFTACGSASPPAKP